MVDDMNGAVVIAGRILGFGEQLPNLTGEQLAQVKDLLLQFKGNARGIAPSFGDLTDMLVSGEIIVTYPGWAAVNVWAKDRGANILHTIPAEGGFAFIDAFAIPAASDNVETALAWINEALGPEVQACQAAALAAGVVNPQAVPLLDATTASLYPYDQIDSVFTNAPVYSLPPRESRSSPHTTSGYRCGKRSRRPEALDLRPEAPLSPLVDDNIAVRQGTFPA